MTTSSRQTVREALGTLLTAQMTGVGQPVEVVYDYPKIKYEGASPIIALMSAGSDRTPSGYGIDQPKFYITAFVFVLLADPDNSYTEADAEDKLDAIEKRLTEVLLANGETANWQNIQYSGRTTTDTVLVGGIAYRRESVPILVECAGDE